LNTRTTSPSFRPRAADVDQAIALILESARRHGVALEAATLKAHLRSNSEAQQQELADEQMSEVAGGRSFAGGLASTPHADASESTVWGYQRFRVI